MAEKLEPEDVDFMNEIIRDPKAEEMIELRRRLLSYIQGKNPDLVREAYKEIVWPEEE